MEKSRIDLPIGITLDRFIKSNENQYPNAAGELSQLLRDIALASKVVNREINKAGLIDIMGNMGQQNLGGDEQQKLDLLANIRFTRALSKGGEACGIISEETESFIDLKNKGKYIVAIDPLDGSSNIDVNVSIGTIDSHNFVTSVECMEDTRWVLDRYDADGVFARECFEKAKTILYINKVLSVYNTLR